MLNYTVYQYQFGAFPTWRPRPHRGAGLLPGFRGRLLQHWPNTLLGNRNITSAGQQYYSDLNLLRQRKAWTGGPTTPSSRSSIFRWATRWPSCRGWALRSRRTVGPARCRGIRRPAIPTYRLYPGGKQYHSLYTVSGSLQATAPGPDMTNNPLGIHSATGPLSLYDNATFQGTLATSYSAGGRHRTVRGTGVCFNPVTLPSLDGTATAIQLPVVVGGNNFTINANSNVTINGRGGRGRHFRHRIGRPDGHHHEFPRPAHSRGGLRLRPVRNG